MWDLIIEAFPTFLGAVVGAAASISATVLSNRNLAKQQKESLEWKREDDARAFQLSNYLEIQEHLQDMMRSIGLAMYEDERAYRESGVWNPGNRLSEEANRMQYDANRSLIVKIQRVTDDGIRSLLASFRRKADVPLFESYNSEKAYVEEMMVLFDNVNDAVGEKIRALMPSI